MTLPTGQIVQGDVLAVLREWGELCEAAGRGMVQCVITSSPYWGLRDYQAGGESLPGQWGREATPAEHVQRHVELGRALKRVMRPDGVFVLNYGDAYAGSGTRSNEGFNERSGNAPGQRKQEQARPATVRNGYGLKPKDLLGMPWRIAMALQADGWYWRAWWPWVKANGMPESVRDRPALSCEGMLMFTLSGEPTFWTHRDRNGTRAQPAPDYRWVNQQTGVEQATEPEGWREAVAPGGKPLWKRINLWQGHAYYWDQEAVRVGYAPASIERADGSRVTARGAGNVGFERKLSKLYQPRTGPEHYGKSVSRMGSEGDTRKHVRGEPQARQYHQYGRIRKTGDWHRESVALAVEQARAWADHAEQWLARGGVLLDFDGLPLGQLHPTYAYPGSHFATFPPALVRPIIRAATSERGECPACGAPWVREVDVAYTHDPSHGNGRFEGEKYDAGAAENPGPQNMKHGRANRQSTTTGWRPSCECDAGEPVPQIVLDPFAGTGTTCVVAAEEGRHSLGIDLYGGDYDFGGHSAMDRLRAAMGEGPPLEVVRREREGQLSMLEDHG